MKRTSATPSASGSVSRREFLRKSALVISAGPALATGCVSQLAERPRPAEPGPNDKIRVGLIGSGDRGRYVMGVFLGNKEVDCPVVCDVDDSRLTRAAAEVEAKRGRAPETVKDFRRVLDRNDIDCVLVATPDHWHALPTVLACQAGKDVYVEKPLARTIDEGRAIVEAARRHQRIIQMGSQWRSGTHQKEAVEFIKSGQLGKIGLVRGWVYLDWISSIGKPSDCAPPTGVDYDMWLGPAPLRPFNPNRFHFNFRWFWDYAGGLMTDWGVHLLNVMLWAMGPDHPRNVNSSGGKFFLDDNRETPDSQLTTYEFPHYTLLWEHRVGSNNGPWNKDWGIAFNGSAGTLILSADGWEVIPERKQHELQALKKPKGEDEVAPHVRNFLDCVKTRSQTAENPEVGHHVTTVAHLGNIAFRVGRTINWDPVRETILGDRDADRLVGAVYRKPWKLPYSRRT